MRLFSETLEQTDVATNLIPTYKSDAETLLSRLFVPNITKAHSFKGDTLQLETPTKYRSEEYLGVIALMPGEVVYLDQYLTRQTPKQRNQMLSVMGRIESPLSVEEMVGLRDYDHHEFATYVPAQLHPYQLASVTPGGMRSSPKIGGFTTYQKPLLILNIEPDYKVHPSDLGHELMHMLDWDAVGIVENDQKLDLIAWMENRGYHIGHRINRALAASSMQLTVDNPNIGLSKQVDECRESHCVGDGFTPTAEYFDVMRQRSLYMVIDPNFIKKAMLDEPPQQIQTDVRPPLSAATGLNAFLRRLFNRQ